MPRFVLIMRTDDGILGIGETHRGVPEHAVAHCAQRLEGVNPLNVCMQSLPLNPDPSTLLTGWNSPKYLPREHELNIPLNPAYAAFESAMFDIMGKALGVPVYQLLGGAFRTRVPVDFWMGRNTPQDAAARTKVAVELGYRGLKMKSALEDPVAATVRAIAEVGGPEFSIILDPNQRYYRVSEAVRLASELEILSNPMVLEDPFPIDDHDGYCLFRQKSRIPVAQHLFTPRQVMHAVKGGVCDYLNIGGYGMVNFVTAGAIADAAGVLVWHGSGVDLGILESSYLHAAAATRGCVLPSDIFGRLIREHDLLVEPLTIELGRAIVPNEPGLGVQLDFDALERYRVP